MAIVVNMQLIDQNKSHNGDNNNDKNKVQHRTTRYYIKSKNNF